MFYIVLGFLEQNRFEDNDNFIFVQTTPPQTTPADLIKLNNAIINTSSDSFVPYVV